LVDAGKYRVHPLLDAKAKKRIKEFVQKLLKVDEQENEEQKEKND